MTDDPVKHCPRCKQTKPLTLEFWRHRSEKRHLWRPYCFVCDRPPKKGPRPSLIVDDKKHCRECKQWFQATVANFGLNITDGIKYLRPYCKSCQTIRQARYVSENRSKIRAHAKRSYDKHREQRVQREIARDQRERADPILGPIRRAKFNAMAAKRRQNPEYLKRLREWDRQYAKTPIGSARYNRRRARETGAPGEYTRSDVIAIAEGQGHRCFWCNHDITNKVCADHYIPLSRGGSNYASNIVAACGSCNSKKHNKLPDEFRKYLKLRAAIESRQSARLG